MCGICGIVKFRKKDPVDQGEIIAMRDTMIHRGPDDKGIYIHRNVGLGHRRLSIIDLSTAAHQPMSNEDGNVWITYNGEFYNYTSFVDELQSKGHILRSHSDTEVIIHLYEEYGLDETIKRIRGMYAFCLVDFNRDCIFLVRDRFGIKPLYYTLNKNRLAFSSELKAFYKLKDYTPNIREDAIFEYFLYQRLLDYSTLIEDTFELKPGTYLMIQNGSIQQKKYYTLDKIKINYHISESDAIAELDRLLTESINLRLVSDVPLGVFLSGGLDSSIIALKMSEIVEGPIYTISAGYSEDVANEFKWSDQVATRIESHHQKFIDNPEDFFQILPWLNFMHDSPLLQGVAFFKASQFAKNTCTVMLCGQGSDEIFGGYPSYIYSTIQNYLNSTIKNTLGKQRTFRLSQFFPRLGKSKIFRKVGARVSLTDYQLAASYVSSITQEDFEKSLKMVKKDLYFRLLEKYSILWSKLLDMPYTQKILLSEMNNGLQKIVQATDRISMAASIETRVPFLDHHLVEFAFSLPPHLKIRRFTGKYILKKYLCRFFDHAFVFRPKEGFPVPLTQWFLDRKTKKYFKIPLSSIEYGGKFFNQSYFEEYKKVVSSGAMGRRKDAVEPFTRFYSLCLWLDTVSRDSISITY